ncbi:MAG TPA: methyltransferase domain-containing protein [Panacibacter sp.]|nr:methyltransferase domain-containing protein [Panacibacter sp.]HNP46551.1 methyltransferase domain-containing protein [Panacibacter sp.]
MADTVKYVHDPRDHNLDAPREIVPLLANVFQPRSVVDYGCGLGNFLYVFQECGVADVLGYDGDWVNHQQLYISPGHFRVTDLEQVLPDGPRADLVLCLEVAEHLSAAAADTLVDNLVHLGDKIIFSAAVPNQGGQFHVNEQAADYWIAKFRARGFVFYDVFRERFWNNPKVNWWYKQNMFLVMHASLSPDNYLFPAYEAGIRQYIHPDLLAVHAQQASELKQQLRRIKSGRLSLRFYLQLLKTKIATQFNRPKKQSP